MVQQLREHFRDPQRLRPALEVASREVAAVLALFTVAVCAWVFLEIVDEVVEGETEGIDRRILLALRRGGGGHEPIGPRWLEMAAADVTALGSTTVLVLVVAFVAGLFSILGRRREALLVVLAAAGGATLSQGLKTIFDRERPEAALRAVEVMNPSFPSGHAMLSAVVFLTIGVLSAHFARQRHVKLYAVSAAVVTTLLVGLTRVYLGVHWPSDVVAGWSLGAAWALSCWLAAWAVDRPWRAWLRSPPHSG
ncbi:MAG: phosphatase PAP2 family protein [Phenylobacterium sp.]|uniref:phosphatase PAP2 family protein n=1 Tax=Phenylobacterium sp. TaxID=1871053 RepID=UPI00391A43F5